MNRYQKARHYQACIEKRQKRIDRDWRAIGRYLKRFHDEELYKCFEFSSFDQWCLSLHIGPGWAKDLVAIEKSPHRDKLKELSISSARIAVYQVKDLDRELAAEVIGNVEAQPTWHDARQSAHGNDPYIYYEVTCPTCHKRNIVPRAAMRAVKKKREVSE